jgi:hypothetical protein
MFYRLSKLYAWARVHPDIRSVVHSFAITNRVPDPEIGGLGI